MLASIQGWGFTIAALLLITAVFVVAIYSLARELRYVRTLTDFLGAELAAGDEAPAGAPASLELDVIRDEARSITTSDDPAWASKQVRGWQMRAQRLEPALGFWVDFLRQLGLLFTVVGLGLSFTVDQRAPSELIGPLGLAVWTTVAGLFYSVWLSAQFGMKIPVWTDTCEKNIEAWDGRRLARAPSPEGEER